MNKDLLSLIVPTRNRSEYLHRLLSYYADCDFKCPILIGDSSSEEECLRIQRSVQFFSRKLHVNHQILPSDCGIYEATRRLAEATSTPYIVLLADDDLLVPCGLEAAVDFLETHPDYSAAHGMAGLITLSSTGPYGPVEWIVPYPRHSMEQSTASLRLARHLDCHQSLAFSVQRRQAVLTSLQEAVALGLDLEFSELFTGSMSAIWGKTKNLDCLYLMRQAHGQMTSVRGRGVFGWITSATASVQYRRFRDACARELVHCERVSLEEAQESVKKAFWSYLATTLEIKWHWFYGLKQWRKPPPWRRWIGKLPGARTIRRKINEIRPRKADEISLLSLLRNSCRYHADFMPIYRIMTTPMLESDLVHAGSRS